MKNNKKKKVVFVLPSFAGGGAERVLITLMNGLGNTQFERYFIAISQEGPLRNLIDENIEVITLGQNLRVSQSPFKLFLKLRMLKPDIVISTMAHMNFIILLLRPFFPKVKFIVREAITPSYFLKDKTLKSKIAYFCYKLFYPMADIVISPAQIIIDEFQTYFKMRIKRHVLLPNPVDVDKFKLNTNDIISSSSSRIEFVCSGRLHPQKGFDRLIEVLPNLDTDWHLTILGQGEQLSELEDLVNKYNLNMRITFAGFKNNPWAIISSADVLLLPSRHEGLPNVVLESLACGTPVIAMREAGGVEEIYDKMQVSGLCIVDTMEQFLAEMKKIKKSDNLEIKTSLLPKEYSKEHVIKEFVEILR